jgi:hypothetical protein
VTCKKRGDILEWLNAMKAVAEVVYATGRVVDAAHGVARAPHCWCRKIGGLHDDRCSELREALAALKAKARKGGKTC